MLRRIGRIAYLKLVVLIGCLAYITAWSQTPATTSTTWAVAIDRIETLADVDSKITLEKVLDGQAGAFQAQQSFNLDDPTWAKTLWVKIYLRPVAVSTQASSLGSVLAISKPYIGDITLLSPLRTDTGWQWLTQIRGLRHPPQQGGYSKPIFAIQFTGC